MESTTRPAGPILVADGLQDAHVAHGVVRLTLAMLGTDGKPAPCGVIVLPLAQLAGFAQGVVALTRQVETRIREAQTEAGQQADGAEGNSGFRFGS
jgi:hypothetical protein